MIIMFFAAISGIFCLSLFSINFEIQGLNRAIIYTPIELMYGGIDLHAKEPKFNVEELCSKLDYYYEKAITKYTAKYSVDYYFYNKEDDSMCVSELCNAVEISVTATLDFSYQYKRVMYYELLGA